MRVELSGWFGEKRRLKYLEEYREESTKLVDLVKPIKDGLIARGEKIARAIFDLQQGDWREYIFIELNGNTLSVVFTATLNEGHGGLLREDIYAAIITFYGDYGEVNVRCRENLNMIYAEPLTQVMPVDMFCSSQTEALKKKVRILKEINQRLSASTRV